MKLVGREQLKAFCDKHADARPWIEAWLAEVESASWMTSVEVKARYASVSFLDSKIAIFNVKGNDYRLETAIAFRTGVIVVKWVGTHAEYDKRNKQRRK